MDNFKAEFFRTIMSVQATPTSDATTRIPSPVSKRFGVHQLGRRKMRMFATSGSRILTASTLPPALACNKHSPETSIVLPMGRDARLANVLVAGAATLTRKLLLWSVRMFSAGALEAELPVRSGRKERS